MKFILLVSAIATLSLAAPSYSLLGDISDYSLNSDGIEYNYKVYTPIISRPEGAPLIVFLHGCTQNADDFMKGVDAFELADAFQTILLFPEQSQVNNEIRCWNWFLPQNHARDYGEPKAIIDMINKVKDRKTIQGNDGQIDTPIDSSRIYVAGFSAGGALANILGATYPDVFAAIGSHSGIPYRAADDSESALRVQIHGFDQPLVLGQNIYNTHKFHLVKPSIMPIIVLHGRQDLLNRDINSKCMVQSWLVHNHLVRRSELYPDSVTDELSMQSTINYIYNENNNSDDATQTAFIPFSPSFSKPQITIKGKSQYGRGLTVRKYFDLTNDYRPLIEYWRISSVSHAWSGGSPEGSHTNYTGVSASTIIFEFFLRHRKDIK